MNNNGRKTLCKEEFQGCEIVKENKQLKEKLKASEKARKEAIDYIENTDCCTWDNTAHEDLLNLLDIDKGE